MAKAKRTTTTTTNKRQKVVEPNENNKVAEEVQMEVDDEVVEHDEQEAPENDAVVDDEQEASENDDDDNHQDVQEPITPHVSDGRYRNKQRCLVLCSRGVTARYRHLLEDLRTLMPHHKKESKLDPGADGAGRAVNDIAEMRSCNTVLFLECRKRQDAYLWMGRATVGPSVRFHVTNIHTMDELRLTGNCMKGSRPILTFDSSFSKLGHLKLLKELFTDVWGIPRGHPKSKPFVDRVMAFYYADKKVRKTARRRRKF
jgi:ribosome biogenesis protein BRX1